MHVCVCIHIYIYPGGSVVKNLPANVGDTGDSGQSLHQEDPLEKGMAADSSILAWRFPWTEEPGGHRESDTTVTVYMHALLYIKRRVHKHLLYSTV